MHMISAYTIFVTRNWMPEDMKKNIHIIICCTLLALIGCTGKTSDETAKIVDEIQVDYQRAREFNNANQMRLAELYYKKAFEALRDEPFQDIFIYGDAGYRYAVLLQERGDIEGALSIATEILNTDISDSIRSALLMLVAGCQNRFHQYDDAKQNWIKAYEAQVKAAGGERKGVFNMVSMCFNIFNIFMGTGDYDEAAHWLNRFENELTDYEHSTNAKPELVEEYKGHLAIQRARFLLATGKTTEANAVYDSIPANRIFNPLGMFWAAEYLMTAKRYADAADMYARVDTTYAAADSVHMTFDMISEYITPRYFANRKAGRTSEALAIADKINTTIDSALVWQRQNDAAELVVIYQTHEKELALEKLEAKTDTYRIIIGAVFLVCLLLFYVFWRTVQFNRKLFDKNRRLLNEIEQREREHLQAVEKLEAAPETDLTAEQQLYRRLCQLLDSSDRIYTDAELDRSRLAQLIGTNEHYVSDAISACTDGKSTTDFINGYRLRYGAQLLANSNDSVALIAELCGLSRRTFYRLFSETYSMSPTDYRKVVQK